MIVIIFVIIFLNDTMDLKGIAVAVGPLERRDL
jgi:hypothetical protein